MNKNRRNLGLAFFLLLALGAYVFWQWNVLQGYQVTANSAFANTENFRAIQEDLLKDHQELKARVQTTRRETEQNLELVFPADEHLTQLTRTIDDFAARNHFAENPFFVSSIDYGTAKEIEEGSAQALPFTLKVSSSRKNLDRFFDFVDNSGTLASGVRLLSIESVDLQYLKDFNGAFDVSLHMNAYFARPL